MRRVLHSSRKECYPSSSPLQSLNEKPNVSPLPLSPKTEGEGRNDQRGKDHEISTWSGHVRDHGGPPQRCKQHDNGFSVGVLLRKRVKGVINLTLFDLVFCLCES